MNPFQGLLHLLSDPNVAFVLFTIGVYGLIFELQNPNFVTGILGALAIILAFIGFGSLPLNVAGLMLLVLGVVLFALETQVVSHGLLTAGGIVCFLLGASALYTVPGGARSSRCIGVAPPVIVATITTAIIMGSDRARRGSVAPHASRPPGTVGVPVPAGTTGVVQAPLGADRARSISGGETWSARTARRDAPRARHPVRLVGFDGLTAIVEPLGPDEAPTTPGRRRHRCRRTAPSPGGPAWSSSPPSRPWRSSPSWCSRSCTCRSGSCSSTSGWSCSGWARRTSRWSAGRGSGS